MNWGAFFGVFLWAGAIFAFISFLMFMYSLNAWVTQRYGVTASGVMMLVLTLLAVATFAGLAP